MENPRGQKNRTRKKNKFLGTEVPRNFLDQCSLDFAYFLSFQWEGGQKFPGTLFLGTFFLILGGFSPSEIPSDCFFAIFFEQNSAPTAAPLQFGWLQGRLQQIIAAIFCCSPWVVCEGRGLQLQGSWSVPKNVGPVRVTSCGCWFVRAGSWRNGCFSGDERWGMDL